MHRSSHVTCVCVCVVDGWRFVHHILPTKFMQVCYNASVPETGHRFGVAEVRTGSSVLPLEYSPVMTLLQ